MKKIILFGGICDSDLGKVYGRIRDFMKGGQIKRD